MLPYPRKQKTFARGLCHSQTDAERKLWSRLRDRQVCNAKFRRQHPIGCQHMQQAQADQKRTLYLEQRGFRVLRFNEALASIDGVMEQIVRT